MPLQANTWTSILSAGVTGALSGAAAFGPWGAFAGLITMGIAAWQDQSRLKDERALVINQRDELQAERNRYITSVQSDIGRFRTKFDSTYGEGMYDTYDTLFSKILNLPSGTSTVSDLLESLSLDTVDGIIASSTDGLISQEQLSASISPADVNANYLEYMQSQIRDAETAIGLKFQNQTLREQSIINNYYDSIDQYNLQVAQQFASSFLQQRQVNSEIALQTGEIEAAAGSSGLRQNGRGMTSVQQFQKDMSDLAYYSTMNFAIRQYTGQLESANTGFVEQIASIRNENAQLTEQFTNDFFNAMNDYYAGLGESYNQISDAEQGIKGLNEQIKDYDDAIWFD